MSAAVIGLTGQTGAGKSTVSDFLREQGFAVIDCDRVAREVAAPGSECLFALVRAFGEGIRSSDGSLNRRALGDLVFSDKEQLHRLDGLIFPYILTALRQKIAALERQGHSLVILDAPTLFESGADRMCRRILAVTATPESRLARIIRRDALTREQALARMESQLDEAYFRSHADFIIDNSGSRQALAPQLQEVKRYLEREAQSPYASTR